jgi:hypothetical protein
VAGVTAAEELLRLLPPGAVRITIITAGSMLKEVGHFQIAWCASSWTL